MAKAQNTSNTWQTICILCKALRRPNETAMLTLRCVFCWDVNNLSEYWHEWFLQAFHEAYTFKPNDVFGEHINHEIYAKRDTRIALAACKMTLKGKHQDAIVKALSTVEEWLERRTVYDRSPGRQSKLIFYREYRRIVEDGLSDGLTPKAVETNEVVTPLGLTIEVAKTVKEKPLMRKIHKWKVAETGQMGFLDVFNTQIRDEQGRCLFAVYLLWRSLSSHEAWKAVLKSAEATTSADATGRYDGDPVTTGGI